MVDLTNLEKQTKKLVNLKDIVLKEHGTFTEYNVGDKTAIGFGLFKNDKIGVQRAFCNKSTEFPTHQHSEQEYIILYQGKIEVFCEEVCIIKDYKLSNKTNPVILEGGDCAYFHPNTDHSIKILEDTWMIGIIIPSVEGYPHA